MDSPFPPAPELPAVTPPPVPPPTPVYVSPPPARKGNGCLWTVVVLLFLGLIGSLLLNFVLAAGQGVSATMNEIAAMEGGSSGVKHKPKFRESLLHEGNEKSGDRIVQIDLEGVIMSGAIDSGLFSAGEPMVQGFKRQLDQAVKDKRVKAIVLYVNSPGGEVTASDIMHAAVKDAAKVKPVVVYMDSVAASGGYYISCGATHIVASETTLTGSIGVIMESMSYHGLFDKIGMGMNTFTSGPLKDTLSGARPMRDEEKAYIQALVNSMYDRFLTVVSEGRKIPKETLRNGVADGRVVSGRDALNAKLVDKVGYVEDAYAAARDLGKSPNAMIVKYGVEPNLLDLFGMDVESRAKNKIELQLPGAAAFPKLMPGRCYYLPSALVH